MNLTNKGMECKTGLLQDDHLPYEGHIVCLQLVEIDASCNPLTKFVRAVPNTRLGSGSCNTPPADDPDPIGALRHR